MKTNRIQTPIPQNPSQRPSLRFSPTAWAKLLYFRDQGNHEIAGFGVTLARDLLYVQDFITVKQQVTCVSVQMEDQAVADYFEDQVVLGRKPEQFARIWCHTHPSGIAGPSSTDEETFFRVFGSCQWAVMFILCQDNQVYARLSINVGPGAQIQLPVQVDYRYPFGSSDPAAWREEFKRNIHPVHLVKEPSKPRDNPALTEKQPPESFGASVDEVGIFSDFWEDEQEGLFL